MYQTVAECNARLDEIDSVLTKLEKDKAMLLLEQEYLNNLRPLLDEADPFPISVQKPKNFNELAAPSAGMDETPPEMRSRYLLLDVIREKPGLSTRELKKNVEGTIPPEKLGGYLSLLQQKKSIENRGEGKAHGARWYAKL